MKRFSTLFSILLIFSISIYVGHVQNAVANEADWMPDANLRTAVREDLGLANDATFTQAKMLDLTSLHAPQAGISNLTGLEYATNLTSLVAWGNQISSLTPLTNLTKLTEIRIGDNQHIQNLTPLAGLTKLTKLGLQGNNISNVTPLAGLVSLTWLRLARNPVTDFSPLVTLVNMTDSDVDLPEPDTTAPGVSISVPSGVQNGVFNVTITFTETVSGFVQSEVSLSGSAASITSWSANSDNTVYTATITPTASGTATIGVAANVATDAANNQNTAATSKNVTVSVDTTAPGVTVSVPSGTQNGAFNVTITFTETVSGFAQSEVSLSGSTASITSWSANGGNTVYTATITPTASGTVAIGVAANVAADDAGNNNTAATSKTVTVNIPDPIPDPATWMPDANLRTAVRSALGIASDANFSKDDLSTLTTFHAVQAQITNLTGLEYATQLTSLVAWGNQISSLAPLTNLTKLTEIRIGDNQHIQNLTPLAGLTKLTRLGLQGNNISDVTPLRNLVNLTWLRLARNPITDFSPLSGLKASITDVDVTIPDPDTTRPSVSITVPSGTQTGAFDATITFSETVSGFVQSDVSLSGSAASITSWSANSDNTVYTATITPTASGTVTIGVAANVATDAANNQNTAATSKTVTVDVDRPSVTITMPSGVQNSVFDVTITFSEAVSGFVQSEVSLSGSAASITSWSANRANTVYTATIIPIASGTVTVGIAANVATDAANNQNTAATSKTVTVSVDTTAPGVTVSVPSGVQNGAFNITITFTETVSGFVQSDVSLSGSAASITSWSANSGNTVYTATITPTASGTVTIGVAANVATDAANNQNTAATSKTVTVSVDTTAPGVSISVPSSTQNGVFSVTITFTETVSGFAQSEVSLSGSAASITGWSANRDSTVYTATITPTASGTVTIGVAANVATDAANNQNTAATSKTVTVSMDTTAPGITVSVPSGTQNGTFNVTITFTETVSGFTQSEVSLSGSAASITGWSANSGNTVYTATITPTASGTVTIGVAANVATDAANNQNTAATSKTVTIDVDAPTVTIGVLSGTQTGAFDATITFTETVSGFAQSDVSLSGSAASITGWSANSGNTVYTATITPTASGTVTVGVAANVATDAAGNNNTAATSQTVTVNIPDPIPDPATWMPDANLRTAVRSALSIASDEAFSKADLGTLTSFSATRSQITNLTGLEYATNLTSLVAWGNQISSLTPLTNLTKLTEIRIGDNQHIQNLTPLAGLTKLTRLGLQGNNISNVTPLKSLVNLTWLRLARNPITDFSPLSGLKASITDVDVTIPDPDTTRPSVSITVPSGTQTGAFDATITFSETVSGFVQSDVSLSGSAASITSWNANSDDTVYTATITPTASGTVTIGVAANVATDAANNQNTAATSKTVTVDVDKPTVTIGVPSGAQTGAFSVTITFSETVSGFVQSEVSLSGSAASITAWSANSNGTVYTATITPTASGTVTIGVAANVATDAANNQNTAATSKTVTTLVVQLQQVDTTSPGVTISVPSGTQNGAFSVTITFTETVSGFVQSEVSLSGSAASITSWSANSDSTVYTATITPTASGTVTIGVAANVATDAAGNPNLVVTPQTVSIDVDSLGVSISVNSYNKSGYGASISPVVDAIPLVTVTFTEPVKRDEFDPRSALTFSGPTMTINIAAPMSDRCSEVTVDEQTIRLCSQWLYDLTATESGELTFNIAAGVAQDLAGNSNTAATALTVTADIDRPEISRVTVPSGPQTGEFNMTIEFTEPVSPGSSTTGLWGSLRISSSDLTISRSPAGLSYSATFTDERVDRTTYILTLTPDDGRWSMDGKIRITAISSDTVKDAARNLNLQQSLSESVSPYVSVFRYSPYDLDKDDDVDIDDVIIVVQAIGQSGDDITDLRTDINGDGTVNNDDLLLVTDNYGKVWSGAPASGETFTLLDKETLETLDPAALEAQLEILRVESDGSLKYQRAIALLESVLASLRPAETQLLSNYPNPFNPETWIPYHLANDSDVQISIYDINGALVRQLDLGYQQAGYYTNRSRAAYWDGRNEFGERIATGIYFYQLQAGSESFLRKMVILK